MDHGQQEPFRTDPVDNPYITRYTPQDVDKINNPFAQSSFGGALDAMVSGREVRRMSWPFGSVIFVKRGTVGYKAGIPGDINNIPRGLFDAGDSTMYTSIPAIVLKVSEAQSIQYWIPSYEDLFATDWVVI